MVHSSMIKRLPSPYIDSYGEPHVYSQRSFRTSDSMLQLCPQRYYGLIGKIIFDLNLGYTQWFSESALEFAQ
jgi:hypothetical protein